MYCTIDLRFAVPPLANILLHLLLLPSDQCNPHPVLEVFLLSLGFFLFLFLFLFHFISVRLHLTLLVSAEPIRLRFGADFYFSRPLAVTLLAAFLFPPSRFWYVFLISICLSPWLGQLFDMLMRILQAIPKVFIVRTPTQQEEETAIPEVPETPRPEAEFELNEADCWQLRLEHENLEVAVYGHA